MNRTIVPQMAGIYASHSGTSDKYNHLLVSFDTPNEESLAAYVYECDINGDVDPLRPFRVVYDAADFGTLIRKL